MLIVSEDGQWVNEHFARLAEVVNDYDANLELQWIPPGQRTEEADKKNPYRIFDNRSLSIVMFASELDTPQSILARLWGADNANGSVLTRLDAENAATEALKMKERMDDDEMKKDFAAFLIGTKQNYIHTRNPITGEKMKMDDQLRRI
jgi:hypothetical protein